MGKGVEEGEKKQKNEATNEYCERVKYNGSDKKTNKNRHTQRMILCLIASRWGIKGISVGAWVASGEGGLNVQTMKINSPRFVTTKKQRKPFERSWAGKKRED